MTLSNLTLPYIRKCIRIDIYILTFKLMYFSDVMKVSFMIVSRCFAVNPLTAEIPKSSDDTGLRLDSRVSL